MPLDYNKIKSWPFEPVARVWTREQTLAYTRGFGAGLDGDNAFLSSEAECALPMVVVALADGEFWQRNPAAGLQWQKVVHAEEVLTLFKSVPVAGKGTVSRRIEAIFDRGIERGASMHEQQYLCDAQGDLLATLDVTTVLLGDGGFGGEAEPKRERVSIPSRDPDATIDLRTPEEEAPLFRLPPEFEIAAAASGETRPVMLRGLCSFGLAGRAALRLACDNQAELFKRMGVRYVGPMYAKETVRLALWHTEPGKAVFTLRALERDAAILNNGFIEFHL